QQTSVAADMTAAVATAAAGQPIVTGPSVRVARGNNVTVVPVGGNR
ncbi:MAG: Flp pilus assembly protein CpaB, partial [Sphingomonadaceae bacterium]|nr:Flp pilus assembly protein CpaB [Sphingomonadaceae bacterium]